MQNEIQSNSCTISNGTFVVVQKFGGEHLRLCRLTKGQRISIEKLNFDPKDAIGQRFGLFEISAGGKILKPISASNSTTNLNDVQIDETVAVENGQNNRTISAMADANRAEIPRQKLTAEKIAELKTTGIGTSNLVDKLVEGNSAFQERTVYSKEKYVRKKTQKHSDRILILRPTIRLMCQSYYRKDPERLCHLRIDLLGLLLQLSAVHSGNCNVFIYEQALGLVGAAFLERLAGRGNCIFLHKGDWPQSIPCIDAMNLNEQQKSTFLPIQISTFMQGKILENGKEIEGKQQKDELCKNEEEETGPSAAKKPKMGSSATPEFRQKKLEKLAKEKRALELINPTESNEGNGQLDAICLAGRTINSVEILQKVFCGLRLSGSLVVYSPFREHLLAVWKWLRSTGSAVDIQISQHFCRAHQVLPNRTHPLMQQLVSGGYVLHAIKVAPPQLEQQQQREMNRALLKSLNKKDDEEE